jgi:hypothetical protein
LTLASLVSDEEGVDCGGSVASPCEGPLQPYAAGFVAELARLGYTPQSACGQMLLMAHVSRWLAAEGLEAGGLTPEAGERFLAARRSSGYGLYRSPKALVPLLGYLRRAGAGPEAPPPVPGCQRTRCWTAASVISSRNGGWGPQRPPTTRPRCGCSWPPAWITGWRA